MATGEISYVDFDQMPLSPSIPWNCPSAMQHIRPMPTSATTTAEKGNSMSQVDYKSVPLEMKVRTFRPDSASSSPSDAENVPPSSVKRQVSTEEYSNNKNRKRRKSHLVVSTNEKDEPRRVRLPDSDSETKQQDADAETQEEKNTHAVNPVSATQEPESRDFFNNYQIVWSESLQQFVPSVTQQPSRNSRSMSLSAVTENALHFMQESFRKPSSQQGISAFPFLQDPFESDHVEAMKMCQNCQVWRPSQPVLFSAEDRSKILAAQVEKGTELAKQLKPKDYTLCGTGWDMCETCRKLRLHTYAANQRSPVPNGGHPQSPSVHSQDMFTYGHEKQHLPLIHPRIPSVVLHPRPLYPYGIHDKPLIAPWIPYHAVGAPPLGMPRSEHPQNQNTTDQGYKHISNATTKTQKRTTSPNVKVMSDKILPSIPGSGETSKPQPGGERNSSESKKDSQEYDSAAALHGAEALLGLSKSAPAVPTTSELMFFPVPRSKPDPSRPKVHKKKSKPSSKAPPPGRYGPGDTVQEVKPSVSSIQNTPLVSTNSIMYYHNFQFPTVPVYQSTFTTAGMQPWSVPQPMPQIPPHFVAGKRTSHRSQSLPSYTGIHCPRTQPNQANFQKTTDLPVDANNNQLDTNMETHMEKKRQVSTSSNPALICAQDISKWTPKHVRQYLEETDCSQYAARFEEQEIDGAVLSLLSMPELAQVLAIKVGPAIKVHRHITELMRFFSEKTPTRENKYDDHTVPTNA